jgi:hypothetical protein
MTEFIPALQTHGLYEEIWIPEESRFWRLEKRDEKWARPLGFGSVKRHLKELYDVRDNKMDLLGYVKFNPEKHSHKTIAIQIAPQVNFVSSFFHDDKLETIPVDFVHLRQRLSRFRVAGPEFRKPKELLYFFWMATTADAIKLLEAGQLVSGRDNLQQWEHALHLKLREEEMNYFPSCRRVVNP